MFPTVSDYTLGKMQSVSPAVREEASFGFAPEGGFLVYVGGPGMFPTSRGACAAASPARVAGDRRNIEYRGFRDQ